MQDESARVVSTTRFVNEIGLRPGAPDEGRLITYLDNIAGKGGQTEFLHLVLNRGLVILREKIADLESQGKTKDSILASFALENAMLYRSAFLYFAAIENMQSQGQVPDDGLKNVQGTLPTNVHQELETTAGITPAVDSRSAKNDDGQSDDDGKVLAVKRPDWSGLKGLATGKAGGE